MNERILAAQRTLIDAPATLLGLFVWTAIACVVLAVVWDDIYPWRRR